MTQPKTKTYAILFNGIERFLLQVVGQIGAIHIALDDVRFHAIQKQQPNVSYMVIAVEVPSTIGEVTS